MLPLPLLVFCSLLPDWEVTIPVNSKTTKKCALPYRLLLLQSLFCMLLSFPHPDRYHRHCITSQNNDCCRFIGYVGILFGNALPYRNRLSVGEKHRRYSMGMGFKRIFFGHQYRSGNHYIGRIGLSFVIVDGCFYLRFGKYIQCMDKSMNEHCDFGNMQCAKRSFLFLRRRFSSFFPALGLIFTGLGNNLTAIVKR